MGALPNGEAPLTEPLGAAVAPTYQVSLAEAVTQCLLREGVDRVFGVPGGYFTVLFDAFARAGLPSVEGRHEGAAACMAAGYAQASGRIGVVYTQCGPGATNALTGFAAAYMDAIPMVLLASQTPREDHGRDGHQESTGLTRGPDQLDVYRTVSHFRARPPTAASAVRLFRRALTSAVGRRGPAAIELSQDLLGEKVAFEDLPVSAYRAYSTPVDAAGVLDICRMLRSAKRPAILVGDRLAHAGASEDLVAFCEEHEVACAAVDWAKGVMPENHGLCLGVLGQAGHDSAADFFRSADLVLLFGVRMSHATTIRYQRDLFGNAVQVDTDPAEIGRSLPVKLGVVGDLAATLRALREGARGDSNGLRRETAERVAQLRRSHRVYEPAQSAAEDEPILPTRLFQVLRHELPRETLVVGDTGYTAIGLKRHFPVYARDGFFALYGLAPMGSGLPMSLGVQLARPQATVVDVIGDGGFLVHTGELNVAATHRLPVIHVVVKNGFYKSVADRQMHWFKRYYATRIENPSFARVAQGFGCDGYTCRTAHEVRSAVRAALSARRPSVIEVEVAEESMIENIPPELKKYLDRLFADRRDDWPLPKPGT